MGRPKQAEPNLSPQQREVLKLISQGKTVREIADKLGISENSVKKRRQKLFKKLNVNSALQVCVQIHAQAA